MPTPAQLARLARLEGRDAPTDPDLVRVIVAQTGKGAAMLAALVAAGRADPNRVLILEGPPPDRWEAECAAQQRALLAGVLA